jgi:hypothetical protein
MSSFFHELKRRNVYKVALGYAVIAWLLIEVASILLPAWQAPSGVLTFFVAIVGFGFPIALVIAWSFEITPDGMKRTHNILPNEKLPYWSPRKFAVFITVTALLAAVLLAIQLLRPQ